MTHLISISATVLSVASFAAAQATLAPTPASPALLKAAGVAGGTVHDIVPLQNTRQRMQTTVVLGGRSHTLDLFPHSLRSDGYKLWIDDGKTLREAKPPVETTYTGYVRGIPDSLVAMSIFRGQLTGQIHYGRHAWNIQPVSAFDKSASPRLHLAWLGHGHGRRATTLPNHALKRCDVSADFGNVFYVANGSDVQKTVAAAGAAMQLVDLMWRRDVGVCFKGPNSIIRTTPVYTRDRNACNMLKQVEARWNANHSNVPRDVVLMFNGDPAAQNTPSACGNLSSICNKSKGYAVANNFSRWDNTTRANRITFALGNTFGAQFCLDAPTQNCYTMCQLTNQCLEFGPKQQAAMRQYIGTLTCLSACTGCANEATYTYFGKSCRGTGNGLGTGCYSSNWGEGFRGPVAPTPRIAWELKSDPIQSTRILSVDLPLKSALARNVDVTVHVFEYDTTNFYPGKSLGSVKLSVSPMLRTYNAKFPSPVNIPADTKFYIGMDVPENWLQWNETTGDKKYIEGCRWSRSTGRWQCGTSRGGYFVFRVNCDPGVGGLPLLRGEKPRIGQQYKVSVSHAASSALAILFQSGATLSLDLTAAGAPGCSLYVDIAGVFNTVGALTDGSGNADFNVAVPNITAFCGIQFNHQVFVQDPSANALNWVATQRGQPKIGQ